MDFEIGAWLDELGLGEYADSFRSNDVDDTVLADLTTDDLRELGVASVGHRRRIMAALERAAPTAGSPPSGGDSGGERRIVTIMFCDLVNSTSLSVVADPEDYVEFINRFRLELDGAIEQFGGHVDQYLGDGIMATFGYPRASDHDAERAVAAGLAVVGRAARMIGPDGRPSHVRVGVASGMTVVGVRGQDLAVHDVSAIGEIPNLAARIQSVAEADSVVIAPSTRDLIGDIFECTDAGEHSLKGIEGDVRVWKVIGRSASSRYDALRTARGTGALVGRESELHRILEHNMGPRRGGARASVIVGEPGIGKSRLAREAIARLGRGEYRPLVLQCSPYNAGVAFFPVRYMVREACGVGAGDDAASAEVKIGRYLEPLGLATVQRVGLIMNLLNLAHDAPEDLRGIAASDIRTRTMVLFEELLVAQAPTTSALLIEDLQWIDPSTAEAMERMLPRIALPIVATARPGSLPDWLVREDASVFQLGRLSNGETSRMVTALIGDVDLPVDMIGAIVERSDGIPIFAEELARWYLDAAADRLDTADSPTVVPISLSQSIVARLDRVPHGRRVASVAAAIGREFPTEVLAAVTDLPRGAVATVVSALTEHGVFVPGNSRFGEAIRFRHQMVSDAAYELLLRRERTELHTRIADTMIGSFPGLAAAVPYVMGLQRDLAGQDELASEEWERAALEASGRSAYVEAAGFLTDAIESNAKLSASPATEMRELRLRAQLVSALICSRGYQDPEVFRQVDQVAELGDRVGDRSLLSSSLVVQWVQLLTTDDVTLSRSFAEQAFASSETGSIIDRLTALRMMGTSLLFSGRLSDSMSHYLRFLELFDDDEHGDALRTGHSDHATMVMMGIAEVHSLAGEAEQAAAWRTKVLERAENSGRHHDICHTLVFAGCLHPLILDDLVEARRHTDHLGTVLAEHTLPSWDAFYELFAGIVGFRETRDRSALEQARRAVGRLIEDRSYGSWWLVLEGNASAAVGDWDRVEMLLDRMSAKLRSGDVRFEAEVRRLQAKLARHRGDLPGARQLLEQALQVAARQGSHSSHDRTLHDLEALTTTA